MELALYQPEAGYYTSRRSRVGLSDQSDFFTASSLGPIFGELVVAACIHLLRNQDPAEFKFIEIGAEEGRSVLDHVSHPFAAVVPVSVTQSAELSGPCIVFSNELFDAQPCRRFIGRGGAWRELGVELQEDGLHESERLPLELPPQLPTEAPEGYHLDLPLRAAQMTEQLASPSWHGLFLAFDYGKSWRELVEATPQGTVRAYHQHKQSNDLLIRAGEQDLTCHVCWDWLQSALDKHGFCVAPIASQEAFLVKNTAQTLARIMQEEASSVSPRKSGLLQLLHPSSLGQKFQVLSATRNVS
ncbi:MAG: hypothetical protein HOH58_13075 [Opitutaceae bacterium]|nr:hypothetical protein [Opitutaceae bacterium]